MARMGTNGMAWKSTMRLRISIFASVLLLACTQTLQAESAFEIPGSVTVDLKEPSSGRIYPVFIKLPRSYEHTANREYPVIYMTDGPYTFPTVSGATRFPMNSGAMEQAIIVAISYAKGSQGPASRIRDYTPVKATDWKRETGNADGHLKFIENVAIPFVENNYRALPQSRTYVGNSLGGLFGAYILLSQPDLFESYILGSPSVWFHDDYILSAEPAKPSQNVRVYVSVGSLESPKHGEREDMVAGAKALVSKLAGHGEERVCLKFSVTEGATHATAFPTTAIQGLDWLYGKQHSPCSKTVRSAH